MKQSPSAVVWYRNRRGSIRSLANVAEATSTNAPLIIDFPDGSTIQLSRAQLQEQADGSWLVSEHAAEIIELDANGSRVIPVIAEFVEIEKRAVDSGGVRVNKKIEQYEQLVEAQLRHEDVVVERVAVNQYVDDTFNPTPRQDGDTLIIPVLEEVVVVQKRLMLKEEIRLTKRNLQRTETQPVTLRREVVSIEQITPETMPDPPHA
ncbi:MAG: YsnF/AvaK domain-containing protein [Herpetosiphon sp.]|nr:YsnF/AvaK domain-containing protein [Herpetosiphon sp.]